MSRVAKQPVTLPKGVEIKIQDQRITAKGSNGELSVEIHPSVEVAQNDADLSFSPRDGSTKSMALTGTMRSLVNNIVTGVATGYERKLTLIGVGYRAKASGNNLDLTLGFSHPVVYELPKGVSAETPTATEIVLKSADKQLIGQVAAEIRSIRPPEPYKGKGVRYADEHVRLKEAKKK
jgi:large subunit ribosomal protein L6